VNVCVRSARLSLSLSVSLSLTCTDAFAHLCGSQEESSSFYNMNVVVLSPVEQSVSLRATLDMPYFRKNVLMLKGSTLVKGDSAMHWRMQKVNASQTHSVYVSMYVCVCVCVQCHVYRGDRAG
jgi:hypothetical protein